MIAPRRFAAIWLAVSMRVYTCIGVIYLDCCEYRVCFADNAYDDRTLLDRLLCIFDLEDAALGREGDRVVVVVVSEHDEGGSCAVSKAGSMALEQSLWCARAVSGRKRGDVAGDVNCGGVEQSLVTRGVAEGTQRRRRPMSSRAPILAKGLSVRRNHNQASSLPQQQDGQIRPATLHLRRTEDQAHRTPAHTSPRYPNKSKSLVFTRPPWPASRPSSGCPLYVSRSHTRALLSCHCWHTNAE